jgi:ligand-binding sensor domain-containing protein
MYYMKKHTAFVILLFVSSLLFSCREVDESSQIRTGEGVIISNDISNQQINSFAEDALGHIWIGTARGANKHNVYEFHPYFNSDDSLSISGNQVQQIFRDSKNRLWFCTTSGVSVYTDKEVLSAVLIRKQKN